MDQGIDGGYLTANLLHTSLIDCTLGTKAGTTYSFSRGLTGGTIQTFYIYVWTLFWVFVSCAGGVSLCRYMLLDQEVAILSINLKGSTVSTVIIYFIIECILCSPDYIKRHIVINVMFCHSSLNCNDICQLTLQVFSIA